MDIVLKHTKNRNRKSLLYFIEGKMGDIYLYLLENAIKPAIIVIIEIHYNQKNVM